jgi:hypothetical protein
MIVSFEDPYFTLDGSEQVDYFLQQYGQVLVIVVVVVLPASVRGQMLMIMETVRSETRMRRIHDGTGTARTPPAVVALAAPLLYEAESTLWYAVVSLSYRRPA